MASIHNVTFDDPGLGSTATRIISSLLPIVGLNATLNVTHPTPEHATLTVTTSPDDPAADINWDLTPAAPGQTSCGLDRFGGILYTLQQRGEFFGKP